MRKLCAGCFRHFRPEEVSNGRCLSCRRAKERARARGTRTSRGYTNDWLRLSATAIRLHPYCARCGRTNDLTADHIVRKAAGGRNELSNVQVLCRACNSAKRDRIPGAGSATQTQRRNPPPSIARNSLSAPSREPDPPEPLVA
jgi:5-methylcytosine-specific restriction protein A